MTFKKITRLALALPLAALFLCAIGACSKTPEERVAKLRGYYTARVIGIMVQAEPVEAAPTDSEEVSGDVTEETETGDGEEVAGEEPQEPTVEMRQNVAVDILLQHDSPEKLPGITLDIEMVDADKQTKQTWKLWVDTSELPKATGTQFTHLLEDIDYEEGDGFNVEVRSPIPAEERSEYREFSVAAGG